MNEKLLLSVTKCSQYKDMLSVELVVLTGLHRGTIQGWPDLLR
jgi:hypothetical protein